MADRPTSQPTSLRELLKSFSCSVPIIDPTNCDDYSVFRETFVSVWLDKDEAAAFRSFGMAQSSMALEKRTGPWRDTELDMMTWDLTAALADLRFLQGFFDSVYENNKSDYDSPREKRWIRLAQRMSKRLSSLGDEIEKELAMGLQEEDE
jgi:hypothetical protein